MTKIGMIFFVIAIAVVAAAFFFTIDFSTPTVGSQTAIVSSTISTSSRATTTITTRTISGNPPSQPPISAPTYDSMVLADHPVAFWNIDPASGTETDLTGNGNTGIYKNGLPTLVTMPNGDKAGDFNGSSEYLTIASNRTFSISTTGNLTWEAWIRPDTIQFPQSSASSYVDYMGKCQNYGPDCEWEARMYDSTTMQAGRSSRLSAYVFNPSAGLGSAADWQPATSTIQAGQWIYVVGEYTTESQPSNCTVTSSYPGSINIWVDGVEWNQIHHSPTGCMSQYDIVPQAGPSPLDIGTMALDTWFKGAIGKVAIYDYLLSPATIDEHLRAMTNRVPAGYCESVCTL